MLYSTNITNKKPSTLFIFSSLAVILLNTGDYSKANANDIPNQIAPVAESTPKKPSKNNSKAPRKSRSGSIQNKVPLADYCKERS
ncbi:hypothetical protein NIES4071_06520 [Calothrix sp. NIES-4071]|nr:hypothetical protein NIES4071_06520 [Calothrix sp. NIES-4071]BAZ54994.1 hypothetical protein NIES4105_06480 [Calothrix sp. NIES-4105]